MAARGLKVTEGEDSCTFAVHVRPRGRRDEVQGLYGDALKVSVKAPPVKGRANRALRDFLADHLGVPVDAVEILSGHTSRHKIVRVAWVRPSQVFALVGEQGEGSASR